MPRLIRNAFVVFAFAFPFAALADTTLTLSTGNIVDLDTGKIVKSGGDFLWDGTNLNLQGSAIAFDLPGAGQEEYSLLSQSEVSADIPIMASTPIAPGVNDVIVAQTNGGNLAKILVTVINGGSITLEFTILAGPAPTPTITALLNNYSGIPAGVPSYGIAPASLFVIYGTDLSDPIKGNPVLESSAAPGLPLTVGHTTISVTVNGIATQPAIYFASPTQVNAVLPSTTPVGSGNITVTYNGTASAAFPIQVTKSAFGMDTLYGTGSGGIVGTVGASVIVPTASASPGQTITIWGSGLGADTANNDRTFPLKQDNLNDAKVYIGGVQAAVTYAGRSQYPGVDQIDVVVPASASSCGNSVVVFANGVGSNWGTLPVNPGGGVCTDSVFGITGNTPPSNPNGKKGLVSLNQGIMPINNIGDLKPRVAGFTTRTGASGTFHSVTGASVQPVSYATIGDCYVNFPGGPIPNPGTITGLDAGPSIALTGGSISAQLTGEPQEVGSYFDESLSTLVGGTAYTFTGPGGKDVGAFKVTVTFPPTLVWTNESSISTVTESQGQLITWTGGAPGTFVAIGGNSSTSPPLGEVPQNVSFECFVPVAAGEFTIPSSVLEELPKGSGSLGLSDSSPQVAFEATGIDSGVVMASESTYNNVTYK